MKQLNLPLWLSLIILSFLTIFLDARGSLNPIKDGAEIVFVPVQYQIYAIKNNLAETFSVVTFWKSGESRIKNLEQRNLELTAEINSSKQLQSENKALREELNVQSLVSRRKLLAPVLGHARYLTIGAGQKDGVKPGQSVIYLDNIIGIVAKVDPKVSFVQLPTDAQSKIPVKTGPDGTVKGVAVGQFGSQIILDQVEASEQISPGNSVLTSGDNGTYDPNLVIGKITKIISQPTDLFKRAEIAPQIKFDKLQYVFILLK